KRSRRPVKILCTYAWWPVSKIRGSDGASKTRCSAIVSSTTPRLGPKCPPVAETFSIKNSRIPCASCSSLPSSSNFRSAGEELFSRIPIELGFSPSHILCARPSLVGTPPSALFARRLEVHQRLDVMGQPEGVNDLHLTQFITRNSPQTCVAGCRGGVAADVNHPRWAVLREVLNDVRPRARTRRVENDGLQIRDLLEILQPRADVT